MVGAVQGVSWFSVHSALLGREVDYAVYRPDAARRAGADVWYLLHGSGGSAQEWTANFIAHLDRQIAKGRIPPIIAIMPSAPRVAGASWWTDSQYGHGLPVQRWLTAELAPIVETTLGFLVPRTRRAIAGYSRGGAAAVRIALTHRDMFSRVVALSPQVYVPLPPAESSARTCPAFGRGEQLFDDERYHELNYPRLLQQGGEPQEWVICAGGDDELAHPETGLCENDLDVEAARLHAYARRAAGITSHLRVLPGGHAWHTWTPGLLGGLATLYANVPRPQPVAEPA